MSLITIAPGPRNAYTDPETGLRFYRWRGKDYPSVTTVRRLAGIPFNLHNWALTQVITRAIDEYDELGNMLTRPRRSRERVLEKNRSKEASKWLRSAATEERDRAADLGTRIHDAATTRQALSDVEPDVRPRLRQFYDWLEQTGYTIIDTERQVFNLRLGYAGTFDLLVRMPGGDIKVVDIKTGKGTYVEHALQLIAYAMAEFIGEDDMIDAELTALLHDARAMSLLHLHGAGWREQDVTPTPEMFDAFSGLLKFAVFAHDHPEISSVVGEEIEGVAVL